MAAQQSPFLSLLPQELRNQVYREYSWHDTGYVYDFDTGKLRVSQRGRVSSDTEGEDEARYIDLSLMYTCRQVADEMRGLPLRVNTIHFSTISTEGARTRAGHWAFLYWEAEVDTRETLEQALK
jgi:hypothetical protein